MMVLERRPSFSLSTHGRNKWSNPNPCQDGKYLPQEVRFRLLLEVAFPVLRSAGRCWKAQFCCLRGTCPLLGCTRCRICEARRSQSGRETVIDRHLLRLLRLSSELSYAERTMGSYYPSTTIHSEIVTTFEWDPDTGSLQAFEQDHQSEVLAVSLYQTWPVTDLLKYPTYRRFEHSATAGGMRYVVYELRGAYGVLFRARTDQDNAELRDYIAYLLVRSAGQSVDFNIEVSVEALDIASRITTLFEQQLFDAFEYKGWKATGEKMFTEKVAYHTSRNRILEMALPAFPCKTTNPDKAASTMPDGAEFEALVTLQTFCRNVENIYPPGCNIHIVSDGHVFADCQGTDDAVVTKYSHALSQIVTRKVKKVTTTTTLVGGVQFYSLNKLLFPDAEANLLYQRMPSLEPIRHPVDTKVEEHDDLCRRILVRAWGPPEEYYRDLIKTIPDHAITALYRGFSRFMFEDLAYFEEFRDSTISQRKKVAESVAFVMIQRNQSYSRLVEGVLPRHVRLSIHAHGNAGPKFAVRLMPFRSISNSAELVVTRENALSESRQHLHVPTPWHNSLVEVHDAVGKVQTMLCKSKIVKEALEKDWVGEYDEQHPRGGRYVIRRKE